MSDAAFRLDDESAHLRVQQLRRFWLHRLLAWRERHGGVPCWLVEEAASICEVSPRSLRRWVKSGEVPTGERVGAVVDERVKELLVEHRNLAKVAEILQVERGRGYSRRNLADRLRDQLTEAEHRDLTGDDWRRGQLTLLYPRSEVNARLHLDWKESSVYVFHPETGEVIKPYIGAAVESGASGLAACIALPGRPSAADAKALVYRAFVESEKFPVHGMPAEIVWDNDPAHTADGITGLLTNELRVPVAPTDAYSPQQNGFAESFNHTIDLRFSRSQLPYAHGTKQRNKKLYSGENVALKWEVFLHKLDEFTRWYRTEHEHSNLNGRQTDEVWAERSADVVTCKPDHLLRLLPSFDATSRRSGIEKWNRHYNAPELVDLVNCRVTVHFYHWDTRTVEVARMGKWVCTASCGEHSREERDRLAGLTGARARDLSQRHQRVRDRVHAENVRLAEQLPLATAAAEPETETEETRQPPARGVSAHPADGGDPFADLSGLDALGDDPEAAAS